MNIVENNQKQHPVAGKRIVGIKKIGKHKVYDITVADSQHYIMENGVVTHNTGAYYSSDTIFIIGRQQDKQGADLLGYNFIINVEKSRYVREKSKLPVCVSFEGGISKWSGLLDLALELGFVTKPKVGWYAKVDRSTGEIDGKNFRAKETESAEFWNPILDSQDFRDAVKKRYAVGSSSMDVDQSELIAYGLLTEEESND